MSSEIEKQIAIAPDTRPSPGLRPIVDQFYRPLETLRVSVTDRCNFRCEYCLPRKSAAVKDAFFRKSERLTPAEFVRLIKIFARLGVKKVRLTGGEPLLYGPLTRLINAISRIPEITDLALTTNGALLSQRAAQLKSAGLNRVTVSLDTLDARIFRRLHHSNFSLATILAGLKAAEAAGFTNIKINVVIKRGTNDDAILDMAEHFRQARHILRFIEFMDTGNCNGWHEDLVVSTAEIIRTISKQHILEPVPPHDASETAERYRYADGKGEVGFISAISKPFCGHCNRLRLASDGKIHTCLFSQEGTDLRAPMREGASDRELESVIRRVWEARDDRYSENRPLFRALADNKQKLEMYKIGG